MAKRNRLISLVLLILVTALIFASCGSSRRAERAAENAHEEAGSEEISFEEPAQAVLWPADIYWGRFGLEGLAQPPGTHVSGTALHMGYFIVGLEGGGRLAFDNLVWQIRDMPGTKLITEAMDSRALLVGYTMPGGNTVNILIELESGDISIQAHPVE